MIIVFCSHLRQQWINLHQTKTKNDQQPILDTSSIHFTKEMLQLCHVTAATRPCTHLLLLLSTQHEVMFLETDIDE